MEVCMFVYTRVLCIDVSACECIHAYVCVCIHVYCVHMRVGTCVCTCVFMCACVYMYMYACICYYVSLCTCVHVCIVCVGVYGCTCVCACVLHVHARVCRCVLRVSVLRVRGAALLGTTCLSPSFLPKQEKASGEPRRPQKPCASVSGSACGITPERRRGRRAPARITHGSSGLKQVWQRHRWLVCQGQIGTSLA